jgi:hypothetical protein
MKTITFFILLTLAAAGRLSAQWLNPPNYFHTPATVTSVGVGNYPVASPPNARLHVNEFYAAAPISSLTGSMFRTDGYNKFTNQWQLFTGQSAATSTEKFKLFVPSGTSHVFLQTSTAGANMAFNTGGALTRMTILGSNGFVGIGITTPNQRLDVSGGNINLNTITRSYMIGNLPVLWHKGNSTNIFVGVNAGLALTSGSQNTFVGNMASGGSTMANRNTMLGFEAGIKAGGNDNTFLGYRAGYNYQGQVVSTFVGSEAGFSEATGDEHVMVGWRSGYNTNGGFHNTFVGNVSGFNNTVGGDNTFIGVGSGGANTTGTGNTALGAGAGMGLPSLANASAIGSGALVMTSNAMILGDLAVNTGIGLSGDPTGPSNKLEIDAGLNGTNPVLAGNVGASGLRFRDLHSNTLTVPNPGPGVLSVDANGDVIYVPGSTSSGGALLCATIPVNNVTKYVGASTLCETNITDLFPISNVGINQVAPNDALDVGAAGSTGNIDVNTPTSSYKLADTAILWHRGNSSNLYVGIQAGDNIGLGSGFGNNNVVIGTRAHSTLNSLGISSVFVGYESGMNTGMLNNSTFVGAEAGKNNVPGADENTFIGWRAGYNNSGLHNVFVGNMSGFNNAGFANTFIGIGSGMLNTSGAFNVALGNGAGPGVSNLQNSIAIGDASSAMNSNQMILGNNSVNAGIGLSGDPTGPSNKLEIDAGLNGTNPVLSGNVGASGLRLRDLHSGTLTVPNPGTGVLSVDASGDVIYVPGGSSSGSVFGNYCGSPQVPMLNSWEVPTAGFNTEYNDVIRGGPAQFGIGNVYSSCGNTFNSKFEVLNYTYNISGAFLNNASLANLRSIAVEGQAASITDGAVGVRGEAQGAAANGVSIATGVEGVSINNSGAGSNYGVSGFASNGGSESRAGNFLVDQSPSLLNYGVNSLVNLPGPNSIENYGGLFEVDQSPSYTGKYFGLVGAMNSPTANISAMSPGTNIGIYGYNPSSTANPNTWAGYFDGDVNINGSGYVYNVWTFSDERLKTHIKPMEKVTDKIRNLQGYTYDFNRDAYKDRYLDDRTHIGLIAQEVKKEFPELVTEDAKGYLAVNYDGMVPVLLQAIKEQQATIDNLQKQMDELKAMMSGETALADVMGESSQSVDLSNNNAAVLNQNVPNPFTGSTVISYNIPEESGPAQIWFYNDRGQMIKVVDLEQKGMGQLTVNAGDLNSGMYQYSLVVDGKVIDTKKMIKSR